LWIARRAEGRPAVTIQGDGSPDKIMLLVEGLTRESASIGHPEGWQPPPLLESGEELEQAQNDE